MRLKPRHVYSVGDAVRLVKKKRQEDFDWARIDCHKYMNAVYFVCRFLSIRYKCMCSGIMNENLLLFNPKSDATTVCGGGEITIKIKNQDRSSSEQYLG